MDLKKREFYLISSKEMIKYVDIEENQNSKLVQTETSVHTPTPAPNNYHTEIPTCTVLSMGEGVRRRVNLSKLKIMALLWE